MNEKYHLLFIDPNLADLSNHEIIFLINLVEPKTKNNLFFLENEEKIMKMKFLYNKKTYDVKEYLSDNFEYLSKYINNNFSNNLHHELLLSNKLKLSMKENKRFDKVLQDKYDFNLNSKLIDHIFYSQFLNNNLTIKTNNKTIDMMNTLIQSIKFNQYDEMIKNKNFQNFSTILDRELNKNKEIDFSFNFYTLSSIFDPKWFLYLDKLDINVFKNQKHNSLYALTFLSSKDDLKNFNSFLISNKQFNYNFNSRYINEVVSENRSHLIHFLALKNKPDFIQSLLNKYPNMINEKDSKKETALFYAIKEKNWDSVLKLVKLGVDLNIMNKDGYIASEYITENDLMGDKIFNLLEKIRINPKEREKLILNFQDNHNKIKIR